MPNVSLRINEIAAALKRHDDILLVAHTSPDGDTIGSVCALYGALTAMGKRAAMACDTTIPHVYEFLPHARRIIRWPAPLPFEPACVVAVDCADLQRLGALADVFAKAAHTLNIDHHKTNPGFANQSLIVPEASSTGALVHELLKALGTELNAELALCVFVAISADTGHFSYSNTTPETFRAAAELAAYGVDIADVTNRIYKTRSLARTRLLGIVLSRVELFAGDTIGVSYVTREELDAHKVPNLEGMIEFIRDIDTLETAVFLREKEKGVIKASFRSKLTFDVGAFAGSLGGGGHQRAAGCTLSGSLADVRDLLIERLLR